MKYKSITEVSYKRDCRIKEKQKSVLGRAALGGIMFGSAGSVVGALSGMGTKTAAVYYYAFGIAFKTNDGEVAVMRLEDRGLSGRNLYQQLKKLCF